MVGGYVWGCLGDVWGRRSVLSVSLTVNACAGLVSAFMPGFVSFTVMRFLSGMGWGGIFYVDVKKTIYFAQSHSKNYNLYA